MIPIWKDYTINLGTAASYLFRVRKGSASGTIIYEGRAYKRPGAAAVLVKVNDICADHLGGYGKPGTGVAVQTFVAQVGSGTSWSNKATFTFVNDWTYDAIRAAYYDEDSDQLLSDPVDTRIDGRYDIAFTYTGEELEVGFRTEDDLAYSSYTPANGQVVVPAEDISGALALEVEGVTYPVVLPCTRYAVHYVNAIGGWDTLLLDGYSKVSDAITRSEVGVEYDNAVSGARGTRNYANEIERTYALRTGWLSDAAAARMHNLIESVNVWLQDLNNGEMMPVVLRETEHTFKTYQNEGRKLVSYDLTAVVAQNYTRR